VNACYKRRRNKFGELESKFERTNDPGGRGYESVSEVTACPTCAANFQAQQRGQPEPDAAKPKARAAKGG
jgi:hypothetical protein